MRTALIVMAKIVALWVAALAALALGVGVVVLVDRAAPDFEWPGWAAWTWLAIPIIGAGLGGWLVSRRSTRGRRIGWIVGGGLAGGLLVFFMVAFLIVASIRSV